jgi:hypothetical protein
MSVNERVLRRILSGNFHSHNTTYSTVLVVQSHACGSAVLRGTQCRARLPVYEHEHEPERSIQANVVHYSHQSTLKGLTVMKASLRNVTIRVTPRFGVLYMRDAIATQAVNQDEV